MQKGRDSWLPGRGDATLVYRLPSFDRSIGLSVVGRVRGGGKKFLSMPRAPHLFSLRHSRHIYWMYPLRVYYTYTL